MSSDAGLPKRPAGSPGSTLPPPAHRPLLDHELPAQRIVLEQRRRPFQRAITWGGWIVAILCLMTLAGQSAKYKEYYDTTGDVKEKFHSGTENASKKIAIIDISGVIMESEGFVKHQIDKVRADDSVKAVVVRVDSPGGTVTGSDYLLHHLNRLREEKKLPIVVSMGSMAASGGYYVAMSVGTQEDSIFAEETTTTGSIGVIIPHYNISGLLEKHNIVDDSIASNPRKELLSMTKPPKPENTKILEQYVMDAFGRFKEVVRSGRPKLKDADLTVLATGEIFTARRAQAAGLVDRIGFIEAAIDRAAELADLEKGSYRAVRYKKPSTLFDFAGIKASDLNRGSGGMNIDLRALLDFTAPRAWYLATSLPAILGTDR